MTRNDTTKTDQSQKKERQMTDAMNETRHIRDTTRAPRALHPQDTPNTPDVTNTKNTPGTENTEHTQNTRRTQDTRRVEPDTSHTGDVAPAQNGLDGELETRWREIKAGFVDHPRQSVEQADELVDEALRQFTTRHRNLLDQWKSGDESDTETLRLALRDYHNLLLQLTGK